METNQPNQSSQDSGFVKKKIEPIILPPEIKERVIEINESVGKNLDQNPSFYKQNRIYIWAICLGVIIISVLSYFAFRKAPLEPAVEAKVKLDISAPETIASGGEAVYQVKIENQDSQSLVKMQLEVTYPFGVVFQSSNVKPENLSGTLFSVPDLISGQDAVIILKTKASGSINEIKTLNAKLSYKYKNFNSEFSKQTSVALRLVASDIALDLSGPQTTSNAQIAVYTLKYKNNSDNDISGARIKFTYPDGFKYSNANPLPDLGSNIWNVGNVPKGFEGSIEIQGNFSDAAPGESRNFLVEFLSFGKNGEYFTQAQTNFVTSIASLPLLISQSLESEQTKSVVNPGDNLNYVLRFQNNGSTVATGVNLVLTLDSKVLDLATLQSEGGYISGNTITWNAAANKQLENLSPSEGGTVKFSVTVKNPATKDSSKNLTIVSNVKIKSNEYETYFPGNTLSLKISSPASIGKALKFASGSLPPKVGKPTVFKASIVINNSSNELSDCILTAFVSTGQSGFVAGSVSSAEANRFDFDPTTGKITWKVGIVPAYAGKFSGSKTLDFGINLLPSASQSGETPVLVKDINLLGKDSFTGEEVNLKGENIQTDDLPGGYQNGRVEQ